MKEDFENWLFYMDDALEEFIKTFPNETRKKLDFTIESLNFIEKWILNRFNNHKEILLEENKQIHDWISRYLGETFRKNINCCKWSIKFDDPKFAFFGLPILIEKKSKNTIVCPYTLTTTVIARNEESFLSNILINSIKRFN